jgi:hypothetical protein
MGTLVLAIAIIVCARWFFRSELAEAVTESIRRRHGLALDPAMSERVEELAEQMDAECSALRAEVLELSERLDFAERALVQTRTVARLAEPTVATESRTKPAG